MSVPTHPCGCEMGAGAHVLLDHFPGFDSYIAIAFNNVGGEPRVSDISAHKCNPLGVAVAGLALIGMAIKDLQPLEIAALMNRASELNAGVTDQAPPTGPLN